MSLEKLQKTLNRKALYALVGIIGTGIGGYFYSIQNSPQSFVDYITPALFFALGTSFWVLVSNFYFKKAKSGELK